MRYMMIIKGNADYEAGRAPPQALMDAMGRLSAEMAQAGILLSTEGLQPTRNATKVRYSRGRQSVVDGPFTEAKEVIGGYAIVRAASKAEALALAQRVVDIHVVAGVPEFEMEIRPLHELGDGCAST